MKGFEEWWEANWNEQDWAGCKKCTESAYQEGMNAAAYIVRAWRKKRFAGTAEGNRICKDVEQELFDAIKSDEGW